MATVRYCFGCERRHYSSASGWYGSDWYDLGEHGVYFCHKHWTRLLRAGYQVIHPASEVLEGAMEQTANTGCRIVAAKFKYDCGAVFDAAVLLGLYSQWAKFDLFILLLAAQFYFPWPMHEFIHGVGSLTIKGMQAKLSQLGQRIFDKYKELRVLEGRLIGHQSRGIQSTKNPSERRNGSRALGQASWGPQHVLNTC